MASNLPLPRVERIEAEDVGLFPLSLVPQPCEKPYAAEVEAADNDHAAEQLLERGISRVVVSMGGRGALYVTGEKKLYAEGLCVPVGSTVGAGDSVVAALAVAESRGYTLEDAAVLSTATGAANVMCSGTQAASRETVESLMPRVIVHTDL